jgi:hypothetical protein
MRFLGSLNLSHNHFSGPIPPSLSTLKYLYLSGNMLSGQVPDEFESDYIRFLSLDYNALYPRDAQMASFLESKDRALWISQTVPPSGFSATAFSSSARLSWSRIAFSEGDGRYEIFKSLNSGGPYTLAGSTTDKTETAYNLSGLAPNTIYHLVIRTVSDPHEENPNTVVSEFSPEISFTTAAPAYSEIHVTAFPAGRSFSVDGTTYSTPQTFSWLAGSSHEISVATPQGTAGTRYVFAGWSDGGTISHSIIVPENPTTYTAGFTTQYLLTTSVSPQSSGTIAASPASPDGYYESGTVVQLRAIANRGYSFWTWSGDLRGTANPQTVTMSAPRNATSAFRLARLVPSRLPPPTPRRAPMPRGRNFIRAYQD